MAARRRAVVTITALLLAAVGLLAPGAAVASAAIVPVQVAIADGPDGALLGMLDSNGNFWAKFLNSPTGRSNTPGARC